MQGEDTDEEEAGDETDVSLIAFPDDALLTSSYREMITHVKSTRLDVVVGAGLGLARKYVLCVYMYTVCLVYTLGDFVFSLNFSFYNVMLC